MSDREAHVGYHLLDGGRRAFEAAVGYRPRVSGRIRRMHPFLAVQAVLGPLFLHLMTRPIAERIVGFEMPIDEVADQLSAAILEGMAA